MKMLTCVNCKVRLDALYCPRCDKEMVLVARPKKKRTPHNKGDDVDPTEPFFFSRELRFVQRSMRRHGIGYSDE